MGTLGPISTLPLDHKSGSLVAIGPPPRQQQTTASAPFLKNGTQKCAFDAVVVSEAGPIPTVSPDD
jgi:hypothetical protein